MSGGSVLRRLGDCGGAMRHCRHLTSVGTPREELLALQQRRLVATARHAAAASPLYRELYAGIEFAEDLDVRALPVVTKAMLMERFDEWVSDPRLRRSEVETHLERVHGDELYLGAYRCMPSNGTTGRKGIFVYDRDEWRQCLTVFLRWSELTGLRPRLPRRLRLATVGATSPLHMSTRFSLSIDLGLYAGCRLDARAPIRELVAALGEHRPEHLVAYASTASLLAIEQLERLSDQSVRPLRIAETEYDSPSSARRQASRSTPTQGGPNPRRKQGTARSGSGPSSMSRAVA